MLAELAVPPDTCLSQEDSTATTRIHLLVYMMLRLENKVLESMQELLRSPLSVLSVLSDVAA